MSSGTIAVANERVFSCFSVGSVAGIAAMDPVSAVRLRSAAEPHLEPLLVDGQVQTAMVSNLLSATKGV